MNGEGERGGKFASTVKLLSRNVVCLVEHRHTRFFYITKDDKAFEPMLLTLFDLLAQGKIDVKIKGVFDLEDIQQAHRGWEHVDQCRGQEAMSAALGWIDYVKVVEEGR